MPNTSILAFQKMVSRFAKKTMQAGLLRPILFNVALNLGVIFVYVVTGYLGLYLATPPGYATAIWIPSGIALGAVLVWGFRTLPGVFVGSLITNFFLTAQFGIGSHFITPLLVGAVIGCGAIFQAMAGWWMIKKWVGLNNLLNNPNDILKFVFLSGPLSCLVNATWSNTALLLLNILPASSYLLSWETWWVGDSMGVLIFTPLFMILFAKPKEVWRQRTLPILFPLCLSFIGILFVYLMVEKTELRRIQSSFIQTAAYEISKLERGIISEQKKSNYNLELLTQQAFINKNNYYSINILDISNPNHIQIKYTLTKSQLKPIFEKYHLLYQRQFDIDGSKWLVNAMASSAYINNRFSWQLWFLFVSGLLFCVLINTILFIIHGQKNLAQAMMSEKEKELKIVESKNLLILRSVGEGIYGIDNEGHTTFINPAAGRILGYKEKELIGKPMHEILHHSHADGSSYSQEKCPIYGAFRFNKIFHITDEVFWRKDGSSIWVEYTSSPIRDEDKVNGAVVVFSDVTKRREMELELQRMAYYDFLTGLSNRAGFLQHLSATIARAKRNKSIFAVCFIDIDNFKQINDNLGHSIGDEMLKTIANLLKPCLRETDYISRLGGDEFSVVVEDIASAEDIHLALERMINAVSQPVKILNVEINISMSIGVAVYPVAGRESEELVKNADIAMYHAKESGKGTYAFFDEAIHKQVRRRHRIDMQMRKAMERNEFSLDYQLQVDSNSMRPLGVEALLRWHNMQLGDISPAEFIPIAEENGLIHQIGEWVLRKACLDYKKILSSYHANKLTLSVNVSVVQLSNVNFLKTVEKILKETQINVKNILLEITETALMRNPEHTMKVMSQIKELGIRFALDDFGVSYSSMQYLKNLPVSLIKIDQGFVRDIATNHSDAEIVNATIQLSHGMGIHAIAEGVETKEQFQILKKMGCEYVQGFYFARPMSLKELLKHRMIKPAEPVDEVEM